jgi:isoquinoline 1-oxidoreductase
MVQAAAERFKRPADTLSVADGKVTPLGSGESFGYADLAKDPAILSRPVPSGMRLKGPSDWKILGTPVFRVGGPEIVKGAHQYASDIRRPGMLYGKIVRPPAYNAELLKIDLSRGKNGGSTVVVRDGNFVGVAAPNSFLAEQAREQLAQSAEWKTTPQVSSAEIYEHLDKNARPGRHQNHGSPNAASPEDARQIKATYNVAYIQHAPMEPRAAVAEWNGDKLTVWTGSQMPSRVREDLARAFQISAERVRVIVPNTGCGFGGKHSGECAVEAARLAKAAGKPVHLRWTREEEFTWAYFRPAGVIHIDAALGADGKLVRWEHVNILSGGSAIETPYDIPNHVSEFRGSDSPLRVGSYRGLASTANNFARESMMDELAIAAGENPLAFRLKHIANERLRNVLTAAAEKFGWEDRFKTGNRLSGYGLACGTEKGSYVACCAKVSINDAGVYKVDQVVEAFECGPIQNPRNLKAQVQGAVIQGMGGAMREQIEFKDGKILNAHFSRYHVPRFKDAPKIEVVLLDRRDIPAAGAGETPIMCIAPAIANAIYNARKVRIRSMPTRSDGEEKIRSA